MTRILVLTLSVVWGLLNAGCQGTAEPPAQVNAPVLDNTGDAAEGAPAGETPPSAGLVSYEVVERMTDGSRRVQVEYERSAPYEVPYEVELEGGAVETRTRTEYAREVRTSEIVVPPDVDLESHLRAWVAQQ